VKRLCGSRASTAAAHLAHAHAQLAVVDAGADRIGAAQVLPVDLGSQREVLALGEAEDFAQIGRHVEGDDDRFLRVGLDGTHAQRMEHDAHGSNDQRGLKCSKGSRQARQR
jgi:hypothetical protein